MAEGQRSLVAKADGATAMYDREHTLALIDEARRLTAGLKIETQQIGVLIDHAFDDEEMDASAGLVEDVGHRAKSNGGFGGRLP